MELKTAAAYIRVSTDSQTELSPDSQIKVIKQYAKQHGFIIPKEHIYRDDGISGRRAEKRPEFIKMIGTAKQKPSPFSTILLWKFSRFARNQEESIFYKGMLRKNGVDVVSVSEPVIDGPFGSLIERIIEWTDEYYSIRLSGEVKRGMTEKVERGGAVSIPAFGYDIVDKKYVVNPTTAPIVQQIFSDYLNGMGFMNIAKKLNNLGIKTSRGNKWENRTVEYVLRNPVYIGKIRWNPKRRTRRDYDDPDIMISDGVHESIIDEAVFEEVQARIVDVKKQHKKYNRQIHDEYMLHGLVKCSDCGASLTTAVKGTSLQCVNYMHGKCRVSHSITIAGLNEIVLNTIDLCFQTGTFNLIVKSPASAAQAIDYSALIKKEENKLLRVREAYLDELYTLDELKELNTIIKEQIESLTDAQNKAISNKQSSKKDFIEKNKKLTERLRSPSTSEAEKNQVLKSFVEKIIFDRKSGMIDIIFYT